MRIKGNKMIGYRHGIYAAAAAALLGWGLPGQAAAGEVSNYSPVTQQRLEHPEAGNWLTYRRTYDGQGYSPLKQINAGNVKSLVPVWTYSTGVNEGHEAPPMVNNGVMFVATPYGQILALNAKTGDLIWRYKHQLPEDLFQLHPTSRGVALWNDRLFLAATDDHLISIDAKTGKEIWNVKVQDYKAGQYMTLEPLVVNGKVMVGGSGGEYGVRGYVVAFDADTGKELWRTFTIPAPGEPGDKTWEGDAWKTGGGSVWLTGTYDPKRKIAYWGTGNAAPWPGDQHPGDNLYTSSTIALDPETGKMLGYHQYHQNDSWDWDEMDPPILINNLTYNGQKIDGLVHPARDGYLWLLKQSEEGIDFVYGKPFVGQNAFKSIDQKTGRPVVDVDHKPATDKPVSFCPSLWGGKDWPSASYNPDTHLLYIPANNNMCETIEGKKQELVVGQLWLGADADNAKLLPQTNHIGELQAWDISTGKQAWMHPFPSQLFASTLTTGGNLVFVGGTNDRMFRAFDAKTGKTLWEQKTNSGIMGMPVAFEVDGTEYIAVQSGWGVDAQRIQDMLAKTELKLDPNVPQGGVIWVFAVKR